MYGGRRGVSTARGTRYNPAFRVIAVIMPTERRTIYFSGRVQGVGFRATAAALAEDLPLGGSIRNLPDGRVELQIEGEAAAIDRLVSRLDEQFGAFIRNVQQTTSPPQGLGRGVRISH